MFDYIKCESPLPVTGANGLIFQTKDTPAQFCDMYLIRVDGMLLHETYDIEDQSDPSAEGLERIVGIMTRVNKRFEPVEFDGEIRFYTSTNEGGWLEFSAYFFDGKLKELLLIKNQAGRTLD